MRVIHALRRRFALWLTQDVPVATFTDEDSAEIARLLQPIRKTKDGYRRGFVEVEGESDEQSGLIGGGGGSTPA